MSKAIKFEIGDRVIITKACSGYFFNVGDRGTVIDNMSDCVKVEFDHDGDFWWVGKEEGDSACELITDEPAKMQTLEVIPVGALVRIINDGESYPTYASLFEVMGFPYRTTCIPARGIKTGDTGTVKSSLVFCKSRITTYYHVDVDGIPIVIDSKGIEPYTRPDTVVFLGKEYTKEGLKELQKTISDLKTKFND